MEKDLVSYLFLPKGIKSILFKSYVYFVPFLYSFTFSSYSLKSFLLFFFIFFLFEFLINPARYQLNDVVDCKNDQKRKHHWQRPVSKNNKTLVITVALLRFTLGTSIAFFLDSRLGYLGIAFLLLQLFYDHFAKRFFPFLSIFVISVAYPLRSLTIFYGLEIPLNYTSFLLLLSIFLYSTYTVIQWRKHESLFIKKNKLTPKPHSDFFINPKIDFFAFIFLSMFLFVFILLVNLLMKMDANSALTIYITSVFVIITLSLNKNTIDKITGYFHNIIIAFLFIVLTLNRFLIALSIAIISIFAMFWYHMIYVKKFANNYFSKTYEEKK